MSVCEGRWIEIGERERQARCRKGVCGEGGKDAGWFVSQL